MHLKWKGFSSHEIISLDQLTEAVTNLIPPVQKVLHCSKHPAKELDLYCETCQEVICRNCILKVHRDHRYDLATDAFPQQRNVLIASVEPAEQQLASVNKAVEGLGTLRGEITTQRQVLETQIRVNMRLIHEALEAREEDLISQLEQLTQKKLKNVATQQDGLELVATRLKSCCGFLQESLRTGSQVEVLAMTKPFVQQVNDVTSAFNPKSLAPEEEPDLEFFSNQNEMTQACHQFGQVFTHPVCHAKCKSEGTGLVIAMVGEIATATVCVVDKKGREYQCPVEVNCELISNDGSVLVRGKSKNLKVSQYEISYQPQQRGQYYLHIRVEDKHISGSPFPLSILTTTPTNTFSGVNIPWGLALNNSDILVVENSGHCVSIYSDREKNRTSFSNCGSGPDQLLMPRGVALHATGDILVCDKDNHRIHIFSPDGKSVKCVGTRGSGPLQFTKPFGIAVHPYSNKIYVAEYGSHRIQILNADLTFYSTFGSRGSGNGEFQGPCDISFDSTGNVYVADTDNHRVQVFTENGECFIQQFGKKGNGDGELCEPKGIAINSSDIVYISEYGNHRISLFTREGHFLRSFGSPGEGPGQFKKPTGITVSNSGVVYVSDSSNNRVQVF